MAQPHLTPGATLIVEFDTPEPCPIDFLGDTADLVYFMSFAHAERYGSDHELARAAAILKRRLRINLAPLLSFGDARTEDPQEEQALETLWQEAAPLAEAARQAADALSMAPELRDLIKTHPDLVERLQELADMAAWAATQGARVRLTYLL